MSMFYELMMRKKQENIMYATIKGSPTQSPYGIFSGFSSSNYLVLQNDITEFPTNFELQTRISIPSTNSGFAIHFLSYSGNSSGIRVFSSGKLNFYSKNNDNNAVEIIGTTVLSLDTFYFIKIKKVGNTITLYSSLDGNNWTTEGTTTTSSTIPLTSKIGFGHCGNPNNNNYIFNGSIDLNNSYIKIGSTKYNLQAVVGYTVVGSPTITDGVVSGFSSSNYLKTNGGFNISNVENFEVVICAKPNSANCLIGAGSGDANSWKILFQSSQVWFIPKTQSASYNLRIGATFDTNTFYYIKATKKGDIATISYSTDGINWQEIKSDTISWGTSTADISIGYLSNYATSFNGSIDLNNTYIKINNKLWFNGQQA